MSTLKKLLAWIAIIGGGVGFFFQYGYLVEFMR